MVWLAYNYHADQVVKDPQNPVPISRAMLCEYEFILAFAGVKNPINKQPKKFAGIEINEAVFDLVTVSS